MRHNGGSHVKVLRKKFAHALVLSAFIATGDLAVADTAGDFWKRLGDSIMKAGKRQPARGAATKPVRKRAGDKDRNNPQVEAADVALITPTPTLTPPPIEMVRVAIAVTDPKVKNADLPYAIPVPNKPGFVTSPFAPNAGLVDVRDFAPGAAVKDPYTGRIFFTP